MWKFMGERWSPPTTSAQNGLVVQEIHVLLVDNDIEGLRNTAKLMALCKYKVSFAMYASEAMTTLEGGQTKFDVVVANINSPDLHAFKLVEQAVSYGVPIALMSEADDSITALGALEKGAFLCMKKPPPLEMLKLLWQHVMREKLRMMVAAAKHPPLGLQLRQENAPAPNNNHNHNNNVGDGMFVDKAKCKKKYRDRQYEEDHHGIRLQANSTSSTGNVRKKMCTEWTQELHAKFMAAVEQLGEGRCFPKEILELMNVPGLTRMQVASHLQKCRNDNWRSPEERRGHQDSHSVSQCSSLNTPSDKPRRFGSKPLLGKTNSNGQAEGMDRGSQSDSPTEPANGQDHHYEHGASSYFNLPDMASIVQNVPDIKNKEQISPKKYATQNSDGPNIEAKSPWSSETSNFESDLSQDKDNE